MESIYDAALTKELMANGFKVESQVEVPVYYKGEIIASNLRLDLIIDRKIIIEIKSVIEYKKVFEKQLYTYLRLMNCEMGYVVNFNTSYLKGSIRPVRNHLYKSEGQDEGEKQ